MILNIDALAMATNFRCMILELSTKTVTSSSSRPFWVIEWSVLIINMSLLYAYTEYSEMLGLFFKKVKIESLC